MSRWLKSFLQFTPLVVLVASASAQDWFSTARHFPYVDRGQIRAATDMDGDGDVDLIWMSETSIQVAFNDGAGEFTDGPVFTPSVPLYLPEPTFDYAKYVSVGDVDGDGANDVVLLTDHPWSNAILFVFFNRGAGTFSEYSVQLPDAPYAFAGSAFTSALGNIDADPALEIATAHDRSLGGLVVDLRTEVRWWNWNGSALVGNTALTLSGSLARTESIVAVDLGHDGIADLVASGYNGSGSPVSAIALLPTVAGAPTLGTTYSVPGYRAWLSAGDLEGDGDVDVVGAHRWGCQDIDFIVLEDQSGAFVRKDTPTISIPADTCAEIARVVLGDVDADGDLDAIQTHMNARSYLNDGTNHFVLGSATPVEIDPDYASTGVAGADVDGDGSDDAITSRAIAFTRGVDFKSIPPAFTGPFANFGAIVIHDVDDDGDLDLWSSNGQLGTNPGSGLSTTANVIVPPTTSTTLSSIVAAADFSGDGRLDVLCRRVDGPYFQQVYKGMSLIADDGTGSYSETGIVVPAPSSVEAHANYAIRRGADFDADGDLDLLVGNGAWVNSGPTSQWLLTPTYSAHDTTDAADVDADGDLDTLVATNPTGAAAVSLMRNTGSGFSAQVLATATAPGTSFRGTFRDLDDDGDFDVIVANPGGTAAALLYENVGGVFGSSVALTTPPGVTGFVDVGDVDGDGLTDVVCERNPTNFNGRVLVEVHRRVGPGLVYETARDWLGGGGQALRDMDEDGDLDVVGSGLVRSRRFEGADDGIVKQYGVGAKGQGNAVPILGASGPLRPGSTTASFRARRGLGGAPAILFISVAGPANYANVLPVTSLLVQIPVVVVSFPLAGTPGATAAGTLDIDTSLILPAVAGVTVWHQLLVIDPAAVGGIAASNGLELQYGL